MHAVATASARTNSAAPSGGPWGTCRPPQSNPPSRTQSLVVPTTTTTTTTMPPSTLTATTAPVNPEPHWSADPRAPPRCHDAGAAIEARVPPSAAAIEALRWAEQREYDALVRSLQLTPALARERDEFAMSVLHWVATDRAVPLRVLQQVVLAHPEATAWRNLAGLLPLHMAVRKDLPLEALKTLLKFYPEAITAETPDGRTVLEMAKEHVTSRSAKVFLHMLDQEVRSLGRLPQATIPASAATTAATESTKWPSTDSGSVTSSTFSSVLASEASTSMHDANVSANGGGGGGGGGDDGDSLALMSAVASAAATTLPPEWKLRKHCATCQVKFGYFRNRHHCRNCGESVCGRHSKHFVPLKHLGLFHPQRICDGCHERLQAHYSRRALATLSPLSSSRLLASATYEDTLPPEFAYSPPRQLQLRSRSAREAPDYSAAEMQHPLVSPHRRLDVRKMRSPLQRSDRSVTLSPRSHLSSASSGRGFRTATTATNPLNFIKTPSAVSIHLTHVQRAGDQLTVQERQEEMRRRRDRLNKTDLETYVQSSPRPWGEPEWEEGEPSNQESNDDHAMKLELQMEKLLSAKKHITTALERTKEDAKRVEEETAKNEQLAKEYEVRGYSCSSLSDHEASSEEEPVLPPVATVGRVTDDNQREHEASSSKPEPNAAVAVIFGHEAMDFPLNRAETHRDLGIVLLAKGDFASAETEFQNSLALEPEAAQTWYHLAKALDGKGDAVEAEAAIHKSLAIEPSSLPALSLLGKLLNARGEHEEAIVVFRKALRLQCPADDGDEDDEKAQEDLTP